jgi:endonuclease G
MMSNRQAGILLPIAAAIILAWGSPARAKDCAALVAGDPPAVVGAEPGARVLLCARAYLVLVSGEARDPLWSAEKLTAVHVMHARKRDRRRETFHEELALPIVDRAQPEDYRGYDRGHMTPAGDIDGKDSREQTYSLANIVPQTAALNRGIWGGIEQAVRNWAERDGVLYIVTGPLLAPSDPWTWDGRVAIPQATWKRSMIRRPPRQVPGSAPTRRRPSAAPCRSTLSHASRA